MSSTYEFEDTYDENIENCRKIWSCNCPFLDENELK